MPARLGLFGGTFNPPHLGHLQAAQACVEVLGLDELIIVPAALPPHKRLPLGSASPQQRLEMAKLMARQIPKARVSTLELERQGASYTWQTVESIAKQYPGSTLWLVVGTDMFLSFHTWREPQRILQRCRLAVVARQHGLAQELKEQEARLAQEFGAQVDFVESPVLVLSSTQVRAGDGGELLPPDVGEYIRQHGLYQFGELDALRQAVRSRQSAKRWQHTQGVEQAAAQLARLYGEEEQAARMAAILHDVTKGLALADQLKLCRQYDIVTNYGENQVKLLHADTGAAVARAEFGADERVCQAIARHTTGAPGMTRLDAILYLADMIEPGRDYPGVEHLRQLCQQDLTQALILGLEQSMEHVRCGGCAPHGRTQETLNQLREKKEIER